MVFLILSATLITFGFLASCMIVRQEKMIYLPRQYSEREKQQFAVEGLIPLTCTTSQGNQVAYWQASSLRNDVAPDRVWLIFSGNGGCATDYASVASPTLSKTGWLFVDYPSYGACEGRPSPDTIRENAAGAIDALAAHVEMHPNALMPRLGVFGHSIGAAAALDIAATAGIRRVVLVAPFTTMKAMAARFITPMLTSFLRHRFDNVDTLGKSVQNGARVIILHGTQDRMIPMTMGKALADAHPNKVPFVPIEGAGHNDIIDLAAEDIVSAMRQVD